MAEASNSLANEATVKSNHFSTLIDRYQHKPEAVIMSGSEHGSNKPADGKNDMDRVTRSNKSSGGTQTRLNFGIKPQPKAPASSGGSTASLQSNKRKRTATNSGQHKSVAKYAHLDEVPDTIVDGLILVLVGNNPGVKTAEMGHPYAHPTNLFWPLLHSSGCTPRLVAPKEHRDLPALFSLGQTNIVSRPTKDASELSKAEMVAGAGILEAKFAQYRPEAVCIVGKGIWEAIWRYKYSTALAKADFKWGWQEERHNMGQVRGEFKGSKVFVATSTSGLAASLSRQEKEDIWKPLGDFVQRRRIERGEQDKSNAKSP